MDRRRAAGVLLALAACVAYATAAPTASNHTSLDIYDGAPDGCYYNFQHYGEGDRIMTNEPCLNCTCHNRMLMCYLRVCPFTKPIGQDCTIEKRADQCCPIVTCPDVPVDLLTSTTTSPAEYGATGLGKLDKYGCSIHGKYFPEGSKVPPTPNKPCEHCYCIRNMTTCVMQECTLHVDGCTPIYHKNVCCPVRYSCDHPEDEMPLLDDLSTTVRPTPGFLLTTTTLSPVTQMSQECLYENQIISDGALIKTEKACDHCYCMKGDIVCVVQECGTPMENEGKNCTALAPREGVCCPDTYICEGDEPTTIAYETEYTTEIEKLTTLSPPRRAGSEGSGYRNEPDSISNTELPTFETETEGSGYEQATIHSPVVTEALPESHKIEPLDGIVFSTTGPHDLNTIITTTKEPVLYDADVTHKNDLQKDTESQQYVPSTDESSTAAQDEDIGSGEEEIMTSYEMVSSTLPAIIASEPTVAGEVYVATTETDKEANVETHIKELTTKVPIIDKDQTNIDTSTPDSAIEIATKTHDHLNEDDGIEASTTLDEKYYVTEHDSLQTTTAPIAEEKVSSTTATPEKDTVTLHSQHYFPASISIPGFEDEIATESQDVATDTSEGPDFDLHHQIAITASTPLLEEIEKDTTEQENLPDERLSSDKFKTSTTLLNVPTEETIYKESLKPDFTDETVLNNLPTTAFAFENDVVTTADPLKPQETDFKDSSESQPNPPTTSSPVFEDNIKEITSSDTINTSKPQEGQETDVDESSEPQQNVPTTSVSMSENEVKEIIPADTMTTSKTETGENSDTDDISKPQQNAPTTSAPVFDDEIKKITPSDSKTTSKTQENQESDVDESLEQQNVPITSAPVFEDAIKEFTPLDTMTTSKAQDGQENYADESSKPQLSAPTTGAPLYVDESKKITMSDFRTTSTTKDGQETDVEPNSETQLNFSTTSAPVFDEENKKTTLTDSMTTFKTQESQEIDVDESLVPQLNAPVTSASLYDDETKKTTLYNTITTAKAQEAQEINIDESSEPQQNAPTTSNPVFEDDIKQTMPSDTNASKAPDVHETDVDESSESQENTYTTSATDYDDETKKTTLSDTITTSKAQEIPETDADKNQETPQYAATTSAPVFEDETTAKTTPTTNSEIQESQELDAKDSEPQQNASVTSAPIYDDETKKTTLSDFITTSKTQEHQKTDIVEGLEPLQKVPITSAPVYDDEVKTTTPVDSVTISKTQEQNVEEGSVPQFAPTTTFTSEIMKASSENTLEPNDITTAEPDKGLNTIPSGSLEEETTESPEKEKYTHSDEMVSTESSTELDTKFSNANNTSKLTTLVPDTSVSRDDQFKVTTESIVDENDDKIVSIENNDITKQTTVSDGISEEKMSTLTYDHPSSTKLPATEYHESSTSAISLITENVKQTTDPIATSGYESSSQVTGLEDFIPEKHEHTTAADLEENEIFNEPRIPGEGDCLLNGVTYRNESTVPNINKCQSGCRCSSSIIKCDPIICSPPPEYMDNCQTTYDSLDSCCPTYVCDHKTETMPPQSHSQMSGTESPVESPIKCSGDECILSEDKKQPEEASELCKSGSCTSQDETSSHPSNIPKQTETDRHEECIGNKCTAPDTTNQLCSKENGCQAVAVKPCEGTECEVTSNTMPPLKVPCVGEHCDSEPDDENKLDIVKECTEKSCKRKDDTVLEQTPPKKCTGSECPSTEFVSELDLTTTDDIDIATEKIEISSVSPSIGIDLLTKPVKDVTDEPGEYITIQTDIVSQPLSTRYPEVVTKVPDKDFEREEINTIYKSTTPSDSQESDESLVTHVHDLIQVTDDRTTTETPIHLSVITEKLESVLTTETDHTESSNLLFDKKSTTETAEKTLPPKQKEDQEKTTLASNESETEPDFIHVTEQISEKEVTKDSPASTLQEMFTEPPTTLEFDDNSYDEKPQKVTKSPLNDDITTETSAIYNMEEVTKLSEEDGVEKVTTTPVNENIGSTTTKVYDSDSHETTKIPYESQNEETTSMDTLITKPHVFDIQETSKSPESIDNDELTKHDLQEPSTEPSLYPENEVTYSPERTGTTSTSIAENINTDTIGSSDIDTQKVKQPSEDTVSEVTTSKINEESDTDTSKYNDTELHKATPSLEQTESEDVTKISPVTESLLIVDTEVQKATTSPGATEISTTEFVADTDVFRHDDTLKDETSTESSKVDNSELLSTTKLADDSEETVEKFTKKPYIPLTTLSIISDSKPPSDITTSKPSEDEQKLSSESHLLEKSTTSQLDTTPELTTQSILVPDSVITETEKNYDTETSTKVQEQSQPTESVMHLPTEPINKGTTTSSETPIYIKDGVTTVSDVTSSDKPSKDSETTDTAMEIVTDTLKEQISEKPDEVHKTTEANVKLNEITLKPTNVYEDDKVQESATEIPVILETENDQQTVSEETTTKSSGTVDDLYDTDLKTELPDIISYPKEQLDTATEEAYVEKATMEPSKIDASEIVTPSDNESITNATPEVDNVSENVAEVEKEPVITQYQDTNTKPTETKEETYTKKPTHSFSEASDSHAPSQDDDKELAIPTINISESTTESYLPTEPSGLQLDRDQPVETPQDSVETEVTELNKVESSTSRDGVEDKETQTITTNMHKLPTVSTQETYTEALEENITTEKPVTTESERINELVTEPVETVTEDTEQEAFEPIRPTVTESVEQMTKVQDQVDNENVDSTSTSPPTIKPIKAPETFETSSELSELTTSQSDIETSTPIHEIYEVTSHIEDENISLIDKESTEIPIKVTDQHPDEVVTESQPDLINIKEQQPITGLMEDELMPSKISDPETYSTTLSATVETAKSTPSPVEEATTVSDQTLPLTSIEPQITEGVQVAPTAVSDQDKATQVPEIQSDKVTTPTDTSLQPEPSLVTSVPVEEKLTTAKVEELSTASPVFDKFTKPSHTITTEAPAAEQPKPIPTEEQPIDDILTPDEEPSIPPSGTSGYGTDPDYMEEDQTFGPGTCRYGGKVYVSAQQIPRDDPCDFCFCFRSDIICLQQSCPPPIHGCHEEPISGFCCPRYECPVSMATTVNVTTTTTTTTTTLPPHFPVHSYKGSAQKRGCLIKGHTYKVGEVVRASSGPCLHCTCGGDGQMKCDPKQCTPEPMLRQMIAAAVSAKRRR